jgi:hypothetical protein
MRSEDQNWIYWTAPHDSRRPNGFKIYISVMPEHLPEGFRRVVDVLDDAPVAAIKLSRQPRGLLRPDRLVVHCSGPDRADGLVADLAAALADLPAHGVPFTASASDHGGVSWSIDPPAAISPYAGSWRRWVSRKAGAYLHASDASSAIARAQFACDRLAQDGVDVRTWAPAPGLWTR